MKWKEYIRFNYLYPQKINSYIYHDLIKIIDNLLKQCRERTKKRLRTDFEKQKKLL